MKTAVYTRISFDRKNTGAGVDRQLEGCELLAKDLGWTVVHTFSDNDISAYSGKVRPGFEALLHAMKTGQVEALICWHPDRLYRHMKDLERIIDIADSQRIEIRTVQGGTIDLSTASGRMVARILGSVARQESEHAGERRRFANDQRAAEGVFYTSGPRTFGYTAKGDPMPGEAEAVAKAVEDILFGKSIRAVAREWNDLGFRTTRKGRAWTGKAVRGTIINPRYAGIHMHRGKVIGKGNWVSLISEDDHYSLVTLMEDNTASSERSFERQFQGSGVYLCGVCGTPLYQHSGGTKEARSYKCPKYHVARSVEKLDDYISKLVVGYLSRPDAPNVAEVDEPTVDLAALRIKRDALQAKLKSLTEMFTEDHIDKDQFLSGTADVREKIAAVDAQMVTINRASPITFLLSHKDRVGEAWEELSPDIRGKAIQALMTVRVLKMVKKSQRFNPDDVDVRWLL